tara:strand:+ start:5676 stop:9410 length:3735 start_codon:yes stop_codon:yes gene_type:complete
MKKLIPLYIFLLFGFLDYGQNSNCTNMNPICTSTGLSFQSNFGVQDASITDPGNNYGCLSTSPNPAWYYLEISQSGDLAMELQANQDIDFILWGPFSNLANAIASCGSYNNILPDYPSGCIPFWNCTGYGCSYDPSPIEYPYIQNAVVGEVYVLLITNYASVVQNISLTQTGGNGATDCNIVNPCSINYINANLTPCNQATGNFDISGVVEFVNPPTTGQLIVENCSGDQAVFNAPFSSPLNYSINGILADGTTNCEVSATFTAEPTCTLNTNFFTEPTCPVSCAMNSITVLPTACNLATGTFDISGVLDFTAPPTTGQLIVENCSGDQTVYNPPFISPLNYSILGIVADGTNNCTVTATFTDDPSCTIISSLFTEPTCSQPCSLIDVSAALTACDNVTGLTYSGDVTFLNQPTTGQLTITDCHGIQQVFNAPFVSPTTYTLSGIPADGQPCQITAAFTAAPSCTFSVPFTPNNNPYVHAMTDTAICVGNSVSLYVDSVSGGVLVEEFNMVFDQAFSHTTINTNLPGTYYAVVSGTFSGAGNCELRDAGFWFYQGCANITPIPAYPWKWNGVNPNTQSQVPTVYNPNHIYQFYFTGGSPQTYSFSEAQPSWYNDNFGTLNFKIYYLGNLSWSNGVTTTTNTVSPLVSTNYTVTIDYGNGCNASHLLNVGVSDLQSNLVVQDVSCIGACDGYIDANVSGGINPISYTWSHDPTLNIDSAGSICANNYTLSVTDSIGCSLFIDTAVIGNQLISIDQLDTISELCFKDSTGHAMVYSTGAYFFSIDSVNYQSDSMFTNLSSGNYTIYLMDSNACKNSVSFTLISPPQITIQANGDTTICHGGSADVNAFASGGTGVLNYFWNNVSSINQQTVFPTFDSLFYVSVIDDNGCRSDSDFVVVNVHPILSISPIQDQNLCEGDSIAVIANVLGGDGGPYNYLWSPVVSSDSIQVLSPTVSTTYSITVSDNCETPDVNETFDINVFPNPTVQFSGDLLNDCSPLVTNFTENITPIGSQCLWDFGDGTTSNSCSNVTHTFINPGCYDISLTAISPQGCETSFVDSQYVCVYDFPIPAFIWTPDTPTVINSFVEFNNNSIDAVSYEWTVNVDGQISSFTDENISFTFPNFQANSYEVCLTATTDFGCDSTYCGFVSVVDRFLIYTPNAFTPGTNDNINNEFKPIIYGGDESYYEFMVFDRWGELLFSTKDINEGWNGEHNGVVCPLGVYVWKVSVKDKFTDKFNQYIGNLTLVK